MRNKIYSIIIIVILTTIVLVPVTSYASTEGSYPKLIVDDYTVQGDALKPGDTTSITINIYNTNSVRSVRNLRLSFEDSTGDILPVKTSSHICPYIGVNKIYQWEIKIFAVESANDALHTISIKMEYEDKRGNQLSAEDIIIIDVVQPVRLEYTEPSLPNKVTQGGVIPFDMNLMNMGKGDIYNALLTFNIDGISDGASIFVGTIQSGGSEEAKINLKAKSDYIGETKGILTLSYEDARGRLYEKDISIETFIQEKIIDEIIFEDNEAEADQEVPWKLIAFSSIGLSIILLIISTIIIFKSKKMQREYDMRL